ncbi:MAG: trehalose-6-phosphate synthase [Nitrospinae bacterium]|nr:trehalose-6-phosphate synthase [Nitrospinota bacterium]
MSRWTATSIAEHITPLIRDTRLILVSNREPYSHRWHHQALSEPATSNHSPADERRWDFRWVRRLPGRVSQLLQRHGSVRWSRPAGGLTSALDPVMQACHGTWIAWGSGTADHETVDLHDRVQVPPNNERFLEKYPDFQGRLAFVQIAVPNRTRIEAYRRVKEQVECLVERLNKRFGSATSSPIHYRYEHLDPAELVAYYRMADFIMVTSLHDGMNLVAKEFVASQVEQKGVLICSEFAGASEKLGNALLINPYDIEGVADTLKQAIEMPAEEKSRRMAQLRAHVAEHNIYKWVAEIFAALEAIGGRRVGTANAAEG